MKRHGLTPHLASATLFLVLTVPGIRAAGDTVPSAATTTVPESVKRMEDLMKRFDTDGDGKLDDNERIAAREIMKKEPGAAGMAGAAPGGPEGYRKRMLEMFDTNKDGRLDDDERAAAKKFAQENGFNPDGGMRDALIKRFDKNGNGRIDEDERAAFLEFVKNRRAQGPASVNREANEKIEFEKLLRSAIEGNAAQLQRFDEDKDGKLNDKEWAAARKRIQAWANDGAAPTPALNPVEEQKRLEAVAADVARRRKLREAAKLEK